MKFELKFFIYMFESLFEIFCVIIILLIVVIIKLEYFMWWGVGVGVGEGNVESCCLRRNIKYCVV